MQMNDKASLGSYSRRRSSGSASSRSVASESSKTSSGSGASSRTHRAITASRRASQSSAVHSASRSNSPVFGQALWDSVHESIHNAGYTLVGNTHGWVAPSKECDNQDWDNIRKAVRRKDRKYVILRRMARDRGVLKDEVFTAIQEEEVMRYLNLPNIRPHSHNHTVELIDIITAKSKLVSARVLILQPSGISSDLYFKQGLCKTEKHWYHYIERVFEGFAFLHENEIAFLDITPNNMLINSSTLKVTLIDFETVVKGPGINLKSPKTGTTPLEDDVKLLSRLFLQHLAKMRDRFPLFFFDVLLQSMFDNPKTAGPPHCAKMRLSTELKKVKRGLEEVRSQSSHSNRSMS